MANKLYRGVIPPVVVPDTEDRQLDVASFERNINRMIEAGVDGLFFLGSSGEVVFSTDERRDEIIREAVRIVDHRVPVFVGIIDTETERVLEHGRRAQELGADVLVATCPFYALVALPRWRSTSASCMRSSIFPSLPTTSPCASTPSFLGGSLPSLVPRAFSPASKTPPATTFPSAISARRTRSSATR